MITAALSGTSGFIGQNLIKALVSKDIKPIPIQREILRDPAKVFNFFADNPVDYIINLASYGNNYDQTNDFETVGANIACMCNLLFTTKDMPYQGFINFSSSSVNLPYETMYSATKAGGERIVKAFVNKYNKPALSVEPYTVIGKGEQSNHLIPTLVRSCKTSEKMKFVPEPVHDFIGINDFLDALMLIMENVDKLKGQNIQIGTGKSTSNQQVREIVEKYAGKPANIELAPSLRPYDAPQWQANPEVIQSLGWKQKQTLEDVIKEII